MMQFHCQKNVLVKTDQNWRKDLQLTPTQMFYGFIKKDRKNTDINFIWSNKKELEKSSFEYFFKNLREFHIS